MFLVLILKILSITHVAHITSSLLGLATPFLYPLFSPLSFEACSTPHWNALDSLILPTGQLLCDLR